ncbi:hypothetical protein Salat_1844700 [Sesamum alatum]|uniref:DUF4283 domain-containing protein n=1 Tax=Sesamum alatum TaxID=300844 RepID=A0AAE1Y3J1_9LAMI|nr:hypothetical protein Salat_1844700 [Sesamum alatum]
MAKTKKQKASAEGPAKTSGQSSAGKAPASSKPAAKALMVDLPVSTKTVVLAQPTADPVSGKETAGTSNTTKVSSMEFRAFISDLEATPSHSVRDNSGTRPALALPTKETVTKVEGTTKTSFAGLFSNNRKLIEDNKVLKFVVDEGPLKLETDDLIDVQAKLEHCLVGYIAGNFPGLKAIRALTQSWGPSFQQHVSGWLIFCFARDEDRQRILASRPYFIFGRPLMLKNMPDCFEFKEDDISLTLVWATLPSLPLECWNPKA